MLTVLERFGNFVEHRDSFHNCPVNFG
jgi:hypothetical protein